MTSDRIDHAAEAREWLAAAERPDMNLDETTAFAHVGQVHATLALVEQQRIANIIAIANNVSGDPDVTVTDGERAAWLALCDEGSPHSLRPEIREALGIRE